MLRWKDNVDPLFFYFQFLVLREFQRKLPLKYWFTWTNIQGLKIVLLFIFNHKKKILVIWQFTFCKSALAIFFPLNFFKNSWPNFCKLENWNSAANSVPSSSSSCSPCIAILKLNPGDGSAPIRVFQRSNNFTTVDRNL